jgi:hypothetical protein
MHGVERCKKNKYFLTYSFHLLMYPCDFSIPIYPVILYRLNFFITEVQNDECKLCYAVKQLLLN